MAGLIGHLASRGGHHGLAGRDIPFRGRRKPRIDIGRPFGQPVRGLPDFEAGLLGAVWRFRNEGNKASFLAHPEVYGPQFGGYDPIDLGRGVILAGNPLFWVISGQRLYLFAREASRDAFAADPERFLTQADKRWPALERGLSQ